MSDRNIMLGKRGEFAARLFYEMRGSLILESNWRCLCGEVDLIVAEDDCLVFCEVKTRCSRTAGAAEEHVTKKKQERYIRCAQLYLSDCNDRYRDVRFDVIAIYPETDSTGRLFYIPNAFGEDWS